MTVCVIVTVSHGDHDPSHTISSVLEQTQHPDELLLIDGSRSTYVSHLISQSPIARVAPCSVTNPAEARNVALKESKFDSFLFINSTHILLPAAVETGRRYLENHPEVDVALFDFEWTDYTGRPSWPSGRKNLNGNDLFLHLLAGDFPISPAAIFYRRRSFDRIGLFRLSAAPICDRDFLLRAASQLSVAVDSQVIAKSVSSELTSKQTFLATRKVLQELDLSRYSRQHTEMRDRGIAAAEETYGGHLWKRIREDVRRSPFRPALAKQILAVSACCPRFVGRELKQFARNALGKRLYRLGTTQQKQVHHLRALARLQLQGAGPVSTQFGFDRGQPVDRYYIEKFLHSQSGAIRGRVLEVKSNDYTVKFGSARVVQSDVLHPDATWPGATIHANLTDSSAFPSDAFDCVILTQTLHLIYDIRAVLRTVFKTLKTGGTLLLTVPCLSKIYHLNEPSQLSLDQDSWRMTRWSLTKLLGEFFSPDRIAVESAGNLAVNTAFLYGLAVQDLPPGALDANDPDNEMILMAVATK